MNFYEDNEHPEEIKPIQEFANKFTVMTPEEEKSTTFEYYDLKETVIPFAFKIKLPLPVLYLLVQRKNFLESQIINRNLRLVFKNARKQTYMGRGLSLYDRVIAGIDGLIYCTRHKYDPYRGFKFSTYSTLWIKQRIGKAIDKYGSLVKTSGNTSDLQSKIRMVVREFCSNPVNKGNKPDADTIAVLLKAKYGLDITAERIAELGRLQWSHVSLDETTDDSSMSLMDHLAAEDSYLPDLAAEQEEMKRRVKEIVAKLNTTEALIISYKYGLIDTVTRTNKQIAATLGLSAKEYSAAESSAINNLKSLIPADFIEFLRN